MATEEVSKHAVAALSDTSEVASLRATIPYRLSPVTATDRSKEDVATSRRSRLVSTRLYPILIVDDNPANLKLARLLLASEGHDARTAPDAEQAMKLLESFVPRLILMDIQLPGMDGLELTRRLKASAATRDIVIIALTAYAMRGDEARAHAAGCDGYIAKPIDINTLPGVIAQYIAEAGGR